MSSITKKKYVVSEALQRYELPDDKHYIVKVGFHRDRSIDDIDFAGRRATWKQPSRSCHTGWNDVLSHHANEISTNDFHQTRFVEPMGLCWSTFGLFDLGDYVLVEDIEEGDKVKAEIIQILLKDNIKYIRSQNCWSVDIERSDDEKLMFHSF